VIVSNLDSQSGTLSNGYTYTTTNPAPSVTSITPSTGAANGGTAVTIAGTGFLPGATVILGGTAATGATVVNDTSIAAITPAHPAGGVSVVVTNTDGQSGTLSNGYTYTLNGQGNPSIGLSLPSGDSSSATVTAGQTASYTLSIGGAGMSGTASLSCTGAPANAKCSIPASQPFSSTVPATFSITVTTTSRTLGALHVPWSWTFAIAMLGILVGPRMRAPKGSRQRYLWVAPLMLSLFLSSCGGGGSSTGSPQPNPNGTPAGTYTLTVQTSSGTMTQAIPLTLTVR